MVMEFKGSSSRPLKQDVLSVIVRVSSASIVFQNVRWSIASVIITDVLVANKSAPSLPRTATCTQ